MSELEIGKRTATTDQLVGYTTVSRLEFVFDPVRSVCDLSLRLENPSNGKAVALTLNEVANLKLKEFGGGLTQLLYLVVEDVRESQLDRINFRMRDVERETFECHYRRLEISDVL